jgi:hypothetical protein
LFRFVDRRDRGPFDAAQGDTIPDGGHWVVFVSLAAIARAHLRLTDGCVTRAAWAARMQTTAPSGIRG